MIRTSESISPIAAEQVLGSLIAFIIIYIAIFGAGTYYILKLIGKGPLAIEDNEKYYKHSKVGSVPREELGEEKNTDGNMEGRSI